MIVLPKNKKLVAFLILAFLTAFFWGIWKTVYDRCNELGFPLAWHRSGLCPLPGDVLLRPDGSYYDWAGARLWALAVDVFFWLVVFWGIFRLFQKRFKK